MIEVHPHIMLQGGVVHDAIALWQRAFPDMSVTAPHSETAPWQLAIGKQTFTVFDSPMPHDFGPTPAWSFMVDVDSPSEVDRLASILGESGAIMMQPDTYDFAGRFAWVADPFGISWQLRFGSKS